MDMYSRKISKSSNVCSEFLRIIVLPNEAGTCGRPLTNEEIWNAFNKM